MTQRAKRTVGHVARRATWIAVCVLAAAGGWFSGYIVGYRTGLLGYVARWSLGALLSGGF